METAVMTFERCRVEIAFAYATPKRRLESRQCPFDDIIFKLQFGVNPPAKLSAPRVMIECQCGPPLQH